MNNQRKFIRINKSLEVSFSGVKDLLRSGKRNKDLSEGGICLPLDKYFPVGSMLNIEIRFDDFKMPIKALAKIAWITNTNNTRLPFEAGLKFIDISPSQRDILRDYIKRNTPADGQAGMQWVE